MVKEFNCIEFDTERLILKPLSLFHLSQHYVDWMNDDEVNKYLESGGNYSLELLKDYLTDVEKNKILFWGIHIKNSNKHIGNIKIDPIDNLILSAEYGIMMGDKTEWGKGYAKEASLAVIEYCFNRLGLHQIILGVKKENINAVKLYQKLNFKQYDSSDFSYSGVENNSDSIRMIIKNDK